MKKYLLLFIVFSLFRCVSAQQLKPELVCTGSGVIGNGTSNVSWTIGEIVISTMNTSSVQLTNGIAQPDYNITAVNQNLSREEIKLFPNPTKDMLVLQTKNGQLKNASYTLFDINGKVLAKDKISDEHTFIDFSHFSSSTYLIKIEDTAVQLIQSYKIIKQ